jgi:hypothetical protein
MSRVLRGFLNVRARRFSVMRSLIDGKSLSAVAYRLETLDKSVVSFNGSCDGKVIGRSETDRLQWRI